MQPNVSSGDGLGQGFTGGSWQRPETQTQQQVERLPLVTLGLAIPRRESGYRELGSGGKRAAKRARAVHAVIKGEGPVRSAGLFGSLPQEIFLRILTTYLGSNTDLLAVRVTCQYAEKLCAKIFENHELLRLSSMREIRAATIWCKDLRELYIDDSQLSDRELCAIARGCTKLKVFSANNWDNVSSHGVGMFFSFLNNLEDVRLFNCWALDDWAIVRLSERCKLVKKICFSNCGSISFESLGMLSQRSTLVDVELSHSPHISDVGIIALTREQASKGSLQRLCLKGCVNITDVALRFLPQYCPRLETLDISAIPNITNKICALLARGCRELKTLYCSQNPNVNSGVTLLLSLSESLETLDVSMCPKVSDVCFLSLTKKVSRKIKRIIIQGCPLVTDHGYRALDAKFPGARVRSCSSSSSSGAVTYHHNQSQHSLTDKDHQIKTMRLR
mmetsp:Transcript_1520/g.2977  ORF Transcript_1520/g.2977 Transcript_1520/m.2977 type:complete len:447 (-) Transcript_1520:106-1446(-)